MPVQANEPAVSLAPLWWALCIPLSFALMIELRALFAEAWLALRDAWNDPNRPKFKPRPRRRVARRTAPSRPTPGYFGER